MTTSSAASPAERDELAAARALLSAALRLGALEENTNPVLAPQIAADQRAAFAGAQACALVAIAGVLDRLLGEVLADHAAADARLAAAAGERGGS